MGPLEGDCFVCKRASSTKCNSCKNVWFCSDEHEALHRDPTQYSETAIEKNCYPFKVAEFKGVGRCLVATRSIEPGELILKESPVVVGNLHETPPVCLACWQLVDGLFRCPRCDLPMCREECSENPAHKDYECQVFSAAKKKSIKIQCAKDQPHPFYECIAPLRLLLVRDKEPNQWALVQNMMDHVNDKPKNFYWEAAQHNIVKYLLETWGLARMGYTADEVNHVIGSLEVNAFEITSKSGGKGRGVYPATALMSHGCVSNARYIMMEDNRVEVRATIHIDAGEEIVDHYVTALNGTMYRRTHLRDGWFFNCRCERCADPTELGTFCSAFACRKCGPGEGAVVSTDPLDYGAPWACQTCGDRREWNQQDLAGIEEGLSERLDDNKNDIKCNEAELEKILEEYSKVLHPRHYLLTAIKRYLIYVYNHNSPKMSYEPSAVLQKKLAYAMDILKMYDVVCPGFTRERGLTLFEVFNVTFYALKLELRRYEDTGEAVSADRKLDMVEALGQCLGYIEETTGCLQFEREGTFEYMVKLASQKARADVSNFCERLKSL